MTAILYPVAPDPEAALKQPMGRAARQSEAQGLAGEAVVFASGPVGPAFATREAALDAHAGRVDDDRPGRGGSSPAAEDRFCRLAETVSGRAPTPVQPVMADGRRWPAAPAAPPATVWRLQVSYWRPVSAIPQVEVGQARQARRKGVADPGALRAYVRQPLRPVKPQQPLDIGLFEIRLPENPDIVMPDE